MEPKMHKEPPTHLSDTVIPAKAGVQKSSIRACGGMT